MVCCDLKVWTDLSSGYESTNFILKDLPTYFENKYQIASCKFYNIRKKTQLVGRIFQKLDSKAHLSHYSGQKKERLTGQKFSIHRNDLVTEATTGMGQKVNEESHEHKLFDHAHCTLVVKTYIILVQYMYAQKFYLLKICLNLFKNSNTVLKF